MSEMVERVAKAIAKCQQELGEDKWRYCLPEARAAIEAMREPTQAMQVAWDEAESEETLCNAEWRNAYNAMIDAALKE